MSNPTPEPTPADPYDIAQGALDDAAAAVDGVQADRVSLREQLIETERELADARAYITELEAQLPKPEPARMLLGGSPRNIGQDGFTQASIDDVPKRAPGAAMRIFENDPMLTTPPKPSPGLVAGPITASWPLAPSARPTKTALTTAFATLPANSRVARNHEFDAKVRKGQYTNAEILPALEHWAGAVRDARPDLLTGIIFTGWAFSPNGPGQAARDAIGPVAAQYDRLMVDLDGITGWPYANYLKHIPLILAYMDKWGIETFTVEELGWGRHATNDPTGSIRLAEYDELLDALEATGRCDVANIYLYNRASQYDLNLAPEQQWFKTRVAEHNQVSA